MRSITEPYCSSSNQPKTVLVVDDDPGMRDSAGLLLSRVLGVRVDTAESALAAYTILRERKVELVLVDLCLPDLSGLDLVRRLRQERISVPWILMSGFMDLDAAHEAGILGALRAVALPTDLVALVNDALVEIEDCRVWPMLPVSTRLRGAGTSAEHWVNVVLRACDSTRDPSTIREWASQVAMSYSRLADVSRVIRINPHSARDFTRVLRGLLHTDGRVSEIESVLNVADYRTRDRLTRTAGLVGLSSDQITPVEYFRLQQFIRNDHHALVVLAKTLAI